MDGADTHRQAAVAANGDPRKSSFMTAQQSALFDWLNASTELVPVTARSGDAYSRVDLPFASWAIISNGAVILEPDGKPHQPWVTKMDQTLVPLANTMAQILNEGRTAAIAANIDVRSWIVEEDGMATYVVFKLNTVTPATLKVLENLPMPVTNWTRHFNSETLALIPPGSGKAAAVDYLHGYLNNKGARPTLGFGDSLSDLSYMTSTDILMVPTRSQIADTL
jgi:hydroxymethylpyrimidine pyrophosphatase-like HAD family hydrolase